MLKYRKNHVIYVCPQILIFLLYTFHYKSQIRLFRGVDEHVGGQLGSINWEVRVKVTTNIQKHKYDSLFIFVIFHKSLTFKIT